jgi:hypothetical protein
MAAAAIHGPILHLTKDSPRTHTGPRRINKVVWVVAQSYNQEAGISF